MFKMQRFFQGSPTAHDSMRFGIKFSIYFFIMRKFQNKNKLTFRQTLKKSLHLKRLFIRYRKGFTIVTVASVFAAIFDALVPFFLGNIVDNIINPSFIFHIFNLTIKGVFLFLGLWIMAKILSDIITWKLKKMIGVIGETAESTYVHEGFASILRLPMSYIKNHPIGEMIDRISRASQNVFIVFSDIIADLLPQFLTVIFALFFMLKVSSFLTVIVICILALYMFILFKITPNLATLRRKGNIGYSTMAMM